MSTPIKIKIEGLDKLRAAFQQSPSTIRDQIQKALNTSVILVERNAKLEAPVGVTGHLKSRMRHSVAPFRGTVEPTVKYAFGVHEGTKPHWVAIDSLEKWAKRKGINPYALQKSIAKKGTKANPFMERAAKKSESKVQITFQTAINNITKQLAV